MRNIWLLLALVLFVPSISAAVPDFGCSSCMPVTTKALAQANSLCGALLADDGAAAWLVAKGAYVWQQPGAAMTITGQWTDPADPPSLWLDKSTLTRFFVSQRELSTGTPFFMPGEAEYGPDGEAIPEMCCLLGADAATERYNRHLENYRMWIGFNEGMEFIEPQAPGDPAAAVVFIHPGGALEFYFHYNADGDLEFSHMMAYDYFSA